eukprot:6938430-Alexandrium_andersonii.AAC.1
MEFGGVEDPSKLRNKFEDGDYEQSEHEGELSPTMMLLSQVGQAAGSGSGLLDEPVKTKLNWH